MSGIVALIARSDVIFRNGSDAARNGVRFRIIREIVDIVDDGLRLGGQGGDFMMLAPIGKIIPIARVGFDRIERLALLHAPFALCRKFLIVLDPLIVGEQEIIAYIHGIHLMCQIVFVSTIIIQYDVKCG